MPTLHVKKGDLVEVISGGKESQKIKGERGKVLRTFPEKGRVIVEKINLIKRHTKPSQTNRAGGIVDKEASIHASNVMLVCKTCNKATRAGNRQLENGKKARFCRKCGGVFDN
jgi:large subunit ribosomal protein L24